MRVVPGPGRVQPSPVTTPVEQQAGAEEVTRWKGTVSMSRQPLPRQTTSTTRDPSAETLHRPAGSDDDGAVPGVGTSAEVIDAFVSLADTLVSDHDPSDLLAHLVERAVHLLDLTAAGILLSDTSGALQVVAASSRSMRDLEVFQLQGDDGPCVECFRTGAPVRAVEPGEAEQRWPRFTAAMRERELRGVVAVPLRLRQQTLGALGMFSDAWQAPTDAQVRLGQGLADIATIALLQQRAAGDSRTLTAQLQTALDSRVLIEQAKGVIAAQMGTTVADAFLIMRSTARRRGMRLHDLSLALVEGRTDSTQLDS